MLIMDFELLKTKMFFPYPPDKSDIVSTLNGKAERENLAVPNFENGGYITSYGLKTDGYYLDVKFYGRKKTPDEILADQIEFHIKILET